MGSGFRGSCGWGMLDRRGFVRGDGDQNRNVVAFIQVWLQFGDCFGVIVGDKGT